MDFLSLVPQLHVPSEEYEAFTRDVVTVLWQQISGKRPPSVVQAALRYSVWQTICVMYRPPSGTVSGR